MITKTPSPFAVSAGATSVSASGTVVFSNANGVSFGLNGSTVTASHNGLTTAMASNRGTDFVQATAAFAGTNASGTVASGGVSVSVGNYITTARASTDAAGLNTAQTNVTWTVNSSGISLNAGGYAGTGFTSATTAGTAVVGTNNTAGLSLGVPAFLTTAAQSNHSHGDPTLALTNLTGTTASASNGFTLSLSGNAAQTTQSAVKAIGASNVGNTAGYTGVSTGIDWVFAGSNNVTISQSTAAGGPNTLWVSGPTVGGGQTGISGVQVSDATFTSGTVSFRNANGISFGSSGANGVSASYTVPSTAGLISAVNLSAGTTSTNASAFTFADGGGVSFGLNGRTVTATVRTDYLTTAMRSDGAVGLNVAKTNVTWTVNSSGLTFDARGYAGTGTTFNGANVSGSMTVNSDGVQLSLSAGAGGGGTNLTAYAASNTTQSSTGTIALSSLVFAGAGVASVGVTNGSVVVSAPAQTVQTLGLYVAGDTFGTSSGTADARTVSVSAGSGLQVAASNGGYVVGVEPNSQFEPYPLLTGSALSSHAPASWWFNRFSINFPLAVSNANVWKSLNASAPQAVTTASTGSAGWSYSHGVTLFQRVNLSNSSSRLTTIGSASMGFSGSISYQSTSQLFGFSWVTNTTGGTTSFSTSSSNANWSSYGTGNKLFPMPWVTTLQPGEYFIAHRHSTTTATSNSNVTLFSVSNLHIAPQLFTAGALGGSVTNNTAGPPQGGIASAVTTTTTMALSVVTVATQNNWYVAYSNG